MRSIIMACLALAIAGGVSAQEEEEGDPGGGEASCGKKFSCEGYGHYVILTFWGPWDVPRLHEGCMVCVTGGEPVPYSNCHTGECTANFVGAQIADAIGRADVATLYALAPFVPGRIAYNFARQTIQVMGCSGSLIANLPMDLMGDFDASEWNASMKAALAWPIFAFTQNSTGV